MKTIEGTKAETRLWYGVSCDKIAKCSEQVKDQALQPPILAPRRVTQPPFHRSLEVVSDNNYISIDGVKQPFSRCIAALVWWEMWQ